MPAKSQWISLAATCPESLGWRRRCSNKISEIGWSCSTCRRPGIGIPQRVSIGPAHSATNPMYSGKLFFESLDRYYHIHWMLGESELKNWILTINVECIQSVCIIWE